MSLPLMLLIVMAVLYATGVTMILERSITKVLIGFLLISNATNLLILLVAGKPGQPPIGDPDAHVTDPLPQALMLTAIVITFAVSAFLLALIYRSWRLAQADDVTDDADTLAVRGAAADESDIHIDTSDVSEFDEDPELEAQR